MLKLKYEKNNSFLKGVFMNKKLLKKVIFVAILAFTLFMIASPVFAEMPDIPENVLSSDCQGSDPTLTPTGYLLVISATTLLLLVPFFVLEEISIKNQKHIKETTDEESIKKANKFQVTLNIWSTIFLTLWLAFGFYIITATDYYDDYYEIISFPYPIFAFFVIAALILLYQIVNLIRSKNSRLTIIFQILLLLGIIGIYLKELNIFYLIFYSI